MFARSHRIKDPSTRTLIAFACLASFLWGLVLLVSQQQ